MPLNSKKSRGGFTLIELLTSMAIVAILAAITYGVFNGVKNAQARAQAKAELAVIQQALEQFKSRYGDYPWHDSDTGDYPTDGGVDVTSSMMLYALTGRLKMERQDDGDIDVSKIDDSLDHPDVKDAPTFIDVSKFTHTGPSDAPAALLDPWGNPYIYLYQRENSPDIWEMFGYHLYSTGPDGEEANATIKGKITESTGIFDDDFREVADSAGIIFAGE